MKQLSRGLILFTVLLLVIGAPANAAAGVDIHNEKQVLTVPLDLCGEPVLAEGVDHDLVTLTCSDAGVCSFGRTKIFRGSAVGESTGTEYQFLVRTLHRSIRNPNSQSVSGEQRMILLIGRGGAENHLLHCVFQRVTNARGEATAIVQECHSQACEDGGFLG